MKSLTVSGDTTLLANVVWVRRALTLSRCGAPVILGDASAVVVREGFSHGDGLRHRQWSCYFRALQLRFDESADAITVNGGTVAMAGSLFLSGDVMLESDGSYIVSINDVISVASALIVSGATTLNGATANPGTVGLGNEATDFVTISGSTILSSLRCRHSG